MTDETKASPLEQAAYQAGAVPAGYREVYITWFYFKMPGDKIQGRLLSREPQKAGNNTAIKYTVQTDDRRRVSFLGTSQLDERLKLITIGHDIIIMFDRTEKATGDNKNDMKVFKVFAKDPRPNA